MELKAKENNKELIIATNLILLKWWKNWSYLYKLNDSKLARILLCRNKNLHANTNVQMKTFFFSNKRKMNEKYIIIVIDCTKICFAQQMHVFFSLSEWF